MRGAGDRVLWYALCRCEETRYEIAIGAGRGRYHGKPVESLQFFKIWLKSADFLFRPIHNHVIASGEYRFRITADTFQQCRRCVRFRCRPGREVQGKEIALAADPQLT